MSSSWHTTIGKAAALFFQWDILMVVFVFVFLKGGGGNGVVILVSHGQLDCHQHIAGRTNLPPLNIYKHTLLGTLVCGLAEGVTFPYVIFNMHFLIFFYIIINFYYQ